MTVRKRVRWKVEVADDLMRVVPKDILARNIVRAFMLASSEIEFDNEIVRSYLKIDGHSLKHAEGKGNLPWVKGIVLIDTVFNKDWRNEKMRELLPRINEILADSYPKGKSGIIVHDFVASTKLVNFDDSSYGLYTVDLKGISLQDLTVKLEAFAEAESVTYKEKKTVGRDIFRMEEVTKIRSEVVPLAYIQIAKGGDGITLTFLCNLTANPLQILTILTGKRPAYLKPMPLTCLGYYRYDRAKATNEFDLQEDDLFAILEDRSVYCSITNEPIETDIFTGETYRSKSGDNLCLSADLKGVMKMKSMGVNLDSANVTK
jgi:hypothetical protein